MASPFRKQNIPKEYLSDPEDDIQTLARKRQYRLKYIESLLETGGTPQMPPMPTAGQGQGLKRQLSTERRKVSQSGGFEPGATEIVVKTGQPGSASQVVVKKLSSETAKRLSAVGEAGGGAPVERRRSSAGAAGAQPVEKRRSSFSGGAEKSAEKKPEDRGVDVEALRGSVKDLPVLSLGPEDKSTIPKASDDAAADAAAAPHRSDGTVVPEFATNATNVTEAPRQVTEEPADGAEGAVGRPTIWAQIVDSNVTPEVKLVPKPAADGEEKDEEEDEKLDSKGRALSQANYRTDYESMVAKHHEEKERQAAKDGKKKDKKKDGAAPDSGEDAEKKKKKDKKKKEGGTDEAAAAAAAKQKEEDEKKQKEEQERKAKAEADAKSKEDADAKAKAEADAKSKEEADAKAKAEADAKVKADADAKEKADAEAKEKAEAEAKEKAEADAKQKAEAEAKQKAEAEAKQKEDEEKKRKADEEEKKRKEEEERKKKEDEDAAAAAAKAEQDAKDKEEEEKKKKKEEKKKQKKGKEDAEAAAAKKAEEEAAKQAGEGEEEDEEEEEDAKKSKKKKKDGTTKDKKKDKKRKSKQEEEEEEELAEEEEEEEEDPPDVFHPGTEVEFYDPDTNEWLPGVVHDQNEVGDVEIAHGQDAEFIEYIPYAELMDNVRRVEIKKEEKKPAKEEKKKDKKEKKKKSTSKGSAAPAPAEEPTEYADGDLIEVWSASKNKWIEGTILSVNENGDCECQYGKTKKLIPVSDVPQYIRKREAAPAAEEEEEYYVPGDAVEIWSASKNKWIEGVIKNVRDNWDCDVQYGSTAKLIPYRDVESFIRKIPKKAAGGDYKAGDLVDIWSASKNKWIAGEIVGRRANGDADVKYGTTAKLIPLRDIEKFIRPRDEGGAISEGHHNYLSDDVMSAQGETKKKKKKASKDEAEELGLNSPENLPFSAETSPEKGASKDKKKKKDKKSSKEAAVSEKQGPDDAAAARRQSVEQRELLHSEEELPLFFELVGCHAQSFNGVFANLMDEAWEDHPVYRSLDHKNVMYWDAIDQVWWITKDDEGDDNDLDGKSPLAKGFMLACGHNVLNFDNSQDLYIQTVKHGIIQVDDPGITGSMVVFEVDEAEVEKMMGRRNEGSHRSVDTGGDRYFEEFRSPNRFGVNSGVSGGRGTRNSMKRDSIDSELSHLAHHQGEKAAAIQEKKRRQEEQLARCMGIFSPAGTDSQTGLTPSPTKKTRWSGYQRGPDSGKKMMAPSIDELYDQHQSRYFNNSIANNYETSGGHGAGGGHVGHVPRLDMSFNNKNAASMNQQMTRDGHHPSSSSTGGTIYHRAPGASLKDRFITWDPDAGMGLDEATGEKFTFNNNGGFSQSPVKNSVGPMKTRTASRGMFERNSGLSSSMNSSSSPNKRFSIPNKSSANSAVLPPGSSAEYYGNSRGSQQPAKKKLLTDGYLTAGSTTDFYSDTNEALRTGSKMKKMRYRQPVVTPVVVARPGK